MYTIHSLCIHGSGINCVSLFLIAISRLGWSVCKWGNEDDPIAMLVVDAHQMYMGQLRYLLFGSLRNFWYIWRRILKFANNPDGDTQIDRVHYLGLAKPGFDMTVLDVCWADDTHFAVDIGGLTSPAKLGLNPTRLYMTQGLKGPSFLDVFWYFIFGGTEQTMTLPWEMDIFSMGFAGKASSFSDGKRRSCARRDWRWGARL